VAGSRPFGVLWRPHVHTCAPHFSVRQCYSGGMNVGGSGAGRLDVCKLCSGQHLWHAA
jgi:hypothetical protein